MPFLFTHAEYCDMHFVYGYCDGNASAAVNEYRRRYPEKRIPSKRIFVRVEQTLLDNGCLPSFAVHSEREMVPGDHAQRMDLCHWVKAHPELLNVISFTDEASFTRDGINNLRNVHTWSHGNPHATCVTHFQRRFSLNVVWYAW